MITFAESRKLYFASFGKRCQIIRGVEFLEELQSNQRQTRIQPTSFLSAVMSSLSFLFLAVLACCWYVSNIFLSFLKCNAHTGNAVQCYLHTALVLQVWLMVFSSNRATQFLYTQCIATYIWTNNFGEYSNKFFHLYKGFDRTK